jgi:hypothetical protein
MLVGGWRAQVRGRRGSLGWSSLLDGGLAKSVCRRRGGALLSPQDERGRGQAPPESVVAAPRSMLRSTVRTRLSTRARNTTTLAPIATATMHVVMVALSQLRRGGSLGAPQR